MADAHRRRAGLGVSFALLAAGCLALAAAGVHGVVGDRLVVMRLSQEILPSTPFGGPAMTKAMIHVSWHMTTIGFLTVAVALLLSGSVLDGEAARAVGVLAAGAATGFAALAIGLGVFYNRSPRSLLRHPAPIALTVIAALAWLGAI